jgi:type III secretion protein J
MKKSFNIKTALLLLIFLLCGCNEKLADQLSERQANEIITLLESNNIDAFKVDSGKGKYSIQVSSESLASATVLLTAYNLPLKILKYRNNFLRMLWCRHPSVKKRD